MSIENRAVYRLSPPVFFNEVERRARERWDQLDGDPELAGPWKQLFSQAQSPRHVLSELLQNADDANARVARVQIDGYTFVFEHDGEDFDQEQFASLCRFGFSNKRHLHTIGFRGIGFKSTFSLGDTVEVLTPTLAVAFHRHRFTQPVWLNDQEVRQKTIIRIGIRDDIRRQEVEKNLAEWRRSPVSLLFFNNLTRLEIQQQKLEKRIIDEGPVPESQVVELAGNEVAKLLLVRSEPIPFPESAVTEIRQERISEELSLPPCRVELVLKQDLKQDLDQRLFVVLEQQTAARLDWFELGAANSRLGESLSFGASHQPNRT